LDDYNFVYRMASLKDALRAASPLRYGCFKPKVGKDYIDALNELPCARPHNAEYVGTYMWANVLYAAFIKMANDKKTNDRVHARCREIVAKYVKVPVDRNLRYRTGTFFSYVAEEDWNAGNRGVRCFLWLGEDRTVSRSLKGAGTRGLPVQ
jgi:hypothetical protein